MQTLPNKIKRILDTIVLDVLEYDETSLSVFCRVDEINKKVDLTSSFDELLGIRNFYLSTFNDEFLVLKSDNVDGLFDWLLDGCCSNVEIIFSTYGNQQEEHICDTNNFEGIRIYLNREADNHPNTDSFKFIPFAEIYKDRMYECKEVIDLLNVLSEAYAYMTEEYFQKRKLLCSIAGNWKPLVK